MSARSAARTIAGAFNLTSDQCAVLTDLIEIEIDRATEAEREACASIADDARATPDNDGRTIRDRIRARGPK